MSAETFAPLAVLISARLRESDLCFEWRSRGYDSVADATEALVIANDKENDEKYDETLTTNASKEQNASKTFLVVYKAVIRVDKNSFCRSTIVAESGTKPPAGHLQPGVSSVSGLLDVFDNIKTRQVRDRLGILHNDADYIGAICTFGSPTFTGSCRLLRLPLQAFYKVVVKDSATWMYATLMPSPETTKLSELRWIVEFPDNGWTFRVLPDWSRKQFFFGCTYAEELEFKRQNPILSGHDLPGGFATILAFCVALRHYAQICSLHDTLPEIPLVWDVEPYRMAMIRKE